MNAFKALFLICSTDAFPHRGRPRAALSALEFMGCLIAVVGGAWLGAIYLGVDVNKVAYTALAQSDLLEKVPEGWRPEGPADKTVTREQLVATLREELGSLKSEITSLRTGEGVASANVPVSSNEPKSAATAKDRSIAYWARLNEIALGESDLQQEAEAAFNAENAAKVFAIKARICRFAAKAVEAVPTTGVNETAVQFGRHLGLWYDHGGELYEKAVGIWESPIGPQARTELNEEWKQSEVHHRNEARLLKDKASATRTTLSRVYGEEIPEFAHPAERSEKNENKEKAA
jgi:hypothetical protein